LKKKFRDRVREIRKLDQAIAETRQQLSKLEEDERESLQQLRSQQNLLRHQIRTSYAMGREQGVKLVLNAESPQQIQRMMTYYGYLNRARRNEIQRFRETVDRLKTVREAILDKTDRLQRASSDLAKSRKTLDLERMEREKAVASISRQLQRSQQVLVQKESDQKQLEKVLREIEKAVANLKLEKDATPFGRLRGKLEWPVTGKLASAYGSPTPTGGQTTGMIVASSINQPVKVIHHGRVVFSDWLRGFGLLIIVDHGDGYMSLYGFNQALLKDTGDWVNQGDVLASSGNSGGQREGGLYFEIRHKGKPENPLKWLKKNS
jgi:septal ring factor EnvC (AmiA/AmiB activator)